MKSNAVAASAIGLAVVLIVTSILVSGCSIGDVVKSRVPPPAQRQLGLPPKVSHNESQAQFEAWRTGVEDTARQWSANLADSAEVVGMVQAFGSDLIAQASPYLSGLPFGAPLVGGLAFFGGLFLRRPGDAKREEERIRVEKEASFNAALKRAPVT